MQVLAIIFLILFFLLLLLVLSILKIKIKEVIINSESDEKIYDIDFGFYIYKIM